MVTKVQKWQKDNFTITDDKRLIDTKFVLRALKNSYWAKKRSASVIATSLANSVVLSLFAGHKQIGLARLVSDYATFAWYCDVYVEPKWRGKGLGMWLTECALAHPACQVEKVMLATRDAHGLYAKFGFVNLDANRAMYKKLSGKKKKLCG